MKKLNKNKTGKLFLVSASSGAGKTSLVTKVIEALNYTYSIERVITYTTKTPRINESHGIDYFFLSTQEFEAKIKESFFVECSTSYGAYYGLAKHSLDIIKTGINLIAIVDYQGALSIKQYYKESIAIWIDVPGQQDLYARLKNRATDLQSKIDYRIVIAQKELELLSNQNIFDYRILNDDFNKALSLLINLIEKELR